MTATSLDRITGGRISRQRQWEARGAICEHVRAVAAQGRDPFGVLGPRRRIGSNCWWPEPLGFNTIPACPFCGADGSDLEGCAGREFCRSCGEEWVVGDYDWRCLADVLRYAEDLKAERVDLEEFRCHPCGRRHTEIVYSAGCAEANCPFSSWWEPDAAPEDSFLERAA